MEGRKRSEAFLFLNTNFHKFHIVMETQGWKVNIYVFLAGFKFYFLPSWLILGPCLLTYLSGAVNRIQSYGRFCFVSKI